METLRGLLQDGEWDLCARLAERLLGGEGLGQAEKAFAAYARCRSLSNLNQFSLALEPGQLACFLAREAGEWDLLARSLMELGYVQMHVPGHAHMAVESFRRYIREQERFSEPLREFHPNVLFNLGVAARSSGYHQEALESFRQGWEANRQARRHAEAERCRQDYCWQTLTVGELALAQELIRLGEQYCTRNPQEIGARAHLLNEQARYQLIRGEYSMAAAHAMEAMREADKLPDTDGHMAVAMLTLSTVCGKAGDPETALSLSFLALQEAQKSGRADLIDEARWRLRGFRFEEPEALDTLLERILRINE